MATEIKVWQVSQKEGLVPIHYTPLEAIHLESELESWIEKAPGILGDDLLVIDRQLPIEGIGFMDLLCIDSAGALVIVELKRASTPRQAVAQALDYASWLDSASEAQIQTICDRAQEKLGKPLDEAFVEYFQTQMPKVVGQKHRIIWAAPRLDATAERIINFLANRYNVQINAIFFKYARLRSGEEILARSVLVADEARKERPHRGKKVSLADLLTVAKDRGVDNLLEICRHMNAIWQENPGGAYGGSLSYWVRTEAGWRLLYGINVAGKRMSPPTPSGELDIWIPAENLAEVTGVEEATIRSTLARDYQLLAQGKDCVIRLRTLAQAEALVKQLQEWGSLTKQSKPATA